MVKSFGKLPSGQEAHLYTIAGGKLSVDITEYGATLVSLLVDGTDILLGYDDVTGYATSDGYLGTVVGRNANRIGQSRFTLNGKVYQLLPNENSHNLHSGLNPFRDRFWNVVSHTADSIRFTLFSPDGDQGFPGNAVISVTYSVKDNGLYIAYDAICDQDTVFNLTNHAYFNLFGQDKPEKAMDQLLMLPGRFFNPDDAESIPTGELRNVEGTPFDFRTAKPIGRDINQDYDALNLQGGYDHNVEVYCNPCAVVSDPESGRTMSVYTDCPGVQFYSGNYLNNPGKGGVHYIKRGGICLETQFYPDSVNHPEWIQPFTKAGTPYHSETSYRF